MSSLPATGVGQDDQVEASLNYSTTLNKNTMSSQNDTTALAEHRLYSREIYWRDRYFWFKEQGYLLRPRYHPDWVASWKGTDKSWIICEDGHVGSVSVVKTRTRRETKLPCSKMIAVINSATRISDGSQVMLKKLVNSSGNEATIGRLFSSEPHRSHASNHSIPLLDVLSIPEEHTAFLVLPFLSDWDNPPFETIGETVAFFKQIFQVSLIPWTLSCSDVC